MSPYAAKNAVAPIFTTVVNDRLIKLIEPAELAGAFVLVEAEACANSSYNDVWCVQVVDHHGPCWKCSEELYLKTNGAWAKLVTDS